MTTRGHLKPVRRVPEVGIPSEAPLWTVPKVLMRDVMPWLQEHIEEVHIVDKKLAKKVARSEGALAHLECSAKTGQAVEFLFANTIPKVLNEQVLKKKKKSSSLVKKLGKLLQNGKKEGDDGNIETQSTRSN